MKNVEAGPDCKSVVGNLADCHVIKRPDNKDQHGNTLKDHHHYLNHSTEMAWQCCCCCCCRHHRRRPPAVVPPFLSTLLLMGLLFMQQTALADRSNTHPQSQDTSVNQVPSSQISIHSLAMNHSSLPSAAAAATTAVTETFMETTTTTTAALEIIDTDDDHHKSLERDPMLLQRRLDATTTTTTNTKTPNHRQDNHDDDGIIVVTTVDGSIIALSRTTGETVWFHKAQKSNQSPPYTDDRIEDHHNHMRPHHHSKHRRDNDNHDYVDDATTNMDPTLIEGKHRLLQPLVSTTTTTSKSSSNHEWKTAAVPSVDGRVYLTPGRDATMTGTSTSTADMMTATTMVRQLVSRAPFVDRRGRFYVGSRQATVAALDRSTGEILSVVTTTSSSETPNQMNNHDPSWAGRNIIWIGRVDYSVSLYDARSGEMDVQFSTAELMSINEMLFSPSTGDGSGGGGSGISSISDETRLLLPPEKGDDDTWVYDDVLQATWMNGDKTNTATTTTATKERQPSVIVATPNGKVAYRNPESGRIEWVSNETFDTPVVYAMEASTGNSLVVDILPDARMPSDQAEYLSKELERQIEAMSSSGSSNNHGGPTRRDGEQDIVGVLSSGQLYAMPLGARGHVGQDESKQKKHISISHPHAAATSSSVSLSGSHSKHLQQLTGRHHHSSFHHHDPNERSHHKISKKPCTPFNPNFPACLVGTIERGIASLDVVDQVQGYDDKRHKSNDMNNAALVTIPLHKYVYEGDSHNYQGFQGQYHQYPHRRNFHKALKVLASWLPAAVAFIFVVSFEMGRRYRLKSQREQSVRFTKGSITQSSALDLPTLESEGDVKNVGVIQVTDEVLGYGGHGTVVYKGMVEGRMVAVKRMLSAYHASANREISLLIESDGHPNVVRYFLKEVRGDFVYLALELCDMSLHDLINIIRNRASTATAQPLLSSSIKRALLQITSGVRHLHSLRIVHRDLKPANVLLAAKRVLTTGTVSKSEDDSPYDKFERGEYVAKISDMGLGKQLVGQSSFGLSTFNNASLRGHSNGGESHVGGAGPGSVGWQAPEVMALRVTSESSARSDGSNCGQESSEASPADVPSNNRTSRSVDIFSLGCIFYSTLVPGCHPFGEWFEREANIMRNRPSLDVLTHLPSDVYDLIASMIHRDPRSRPTAKQICDHPFFWDPAKRLQFLCDLSDRLESDAPNLDGTFVISAVSDHLLDIERGAVQIVGASWDVALDEDLLSNVQRFRSYDTSSIRDCLRLIRNKHHHFEELPKVVKSRIGSNPDGLQIYFENKFPRLLMHCYRFCCDYLPADDPIATKYAICPKVVQYPVRYTSCYQSSTSYDAGESSRLRVSHHANSTEHPSLHSSVDDDSSSLKSQSQDATNLVSVCNGDTPLSALASESEERKNMRERGLNVEKLLGDQELVIWEGSAASKTFQCRGWIRSDDEWCRRGDLIGRKVDPNLARLGSDPKFRTRLCNHWDESLGTFCTMKKKNKCVFAHGPVELRIKDGKRNRWGKLVDKLGNSSNPKNSGGEDTYGAARSIESTRKDEGKWNTQKQNKIKKQVTGTT